MARRSSLLLLLLCALPACTGASLQWRGAPRVEPIDGSAAPYLRAYKRSYYRALGDRFVGTTTVKSLVSSVAREGTRVFYLGDHHRDVSLHRRLLALLEELQGAGVPIALGLEALGVEDEEAVADYLGGAGDLLHLRRTMARRWDENWLENPEVDRRFYGELLRRAQRSGWAVFALEPTPRLALRERDAVIAASIQRAAARTPDRLVVVVVGQAHLLGQGNLVGRVGLPFAALGANVSKTLQEQWERQPLWGELLVAASGVLFFGAEREGVGDTVAGEEKGR